MLYRDIGSFFLVGYFLICILNYIYSLFFSPKKRLKYLFQTSTSLALALGVIGIINYLFHLVTISAFRPVLLLQPMIWLMFCFLLWNKRTRNIIWIQLAFCLAFIFTLERIIIILTSFHREYVPISAELPIDTWAVFTSLLAKGISFALFTLFVDKIKSEFSFIRLKSK